MEGGKAVAIDDEGGRGGGKEESLRVKLRRGAAAGKKGGLSTPVPTWKLGAPGCTEGEPGEPKRSSVSARKLAANLWEIQDLVPYAAMSRRGDKGRRHREGKALDDGLDDQPESASSLRRYVAASLVKNYKLNERKIRAVEPVSPASYSSSIENASISQAIAPCSLLDLKEKHGDTGYGLRTSKEFLKLLNCIWSLEEQHDSNISLIKALKVELEHAQGRIQEFMQEQHVYRREMDDLMKQVAEDKLIRKNKEQQKVKVAVQTVRDELEDERHLRRRSESLHRKLGKELSEVNAVYMKALKDLDRERKTSYLLENLCDEFAKGITDYEREVRELRQTSPRDCSHKVDRLVLHISEAWLDERVQMNIVEAQGDLAEKITVTDRLRNEIESFLQARKASALQSDNLYQNKDKKHSSILRQSLESVLLNGATSAPHDADDEDDSVTSDTLCFELNVSTHKHGGHDHLKQVNQNAIEKLQSQGTSALLGEKLAPSDCNENLSELHIQYNQIMDKEKLSGNNMKLFDRSQRVHFPTDDDHANTKFDPDDKSISRQSGRCHSQEHQQDTNQKLSPMNGSKHQACNSVKNFTEISECDSVDRATCHEDSHLLWKSQIASIEEDSDLGNAHQINSQWKQQQTPYLAESSSKLAPGVKESTLKARLLEARLEGKHSRLKTLKRMSTVRIKHRE
ncbi:uncharacterized protein At5g41620-like [Curcuma longa]|uniref:uncharacterized protein At5g41620-like n=1 Tax=Curcuma longa TaxID=136217 RepID=UPI003D9E970F